MGGGGCCRAYRPVAPHAAWKTDGHLGDTSEQVAGWHDFIVEIASVKCGLRRARFNMNNLLNSD